MYFTSRELTTIAVVAAFWTALNRLISPFFWQLTHLPFMCDLLAFVSLILVLWWTRKIGSAALTGLIVTALTLILQPTAFQMAGFIVASILFDLIIRAVGYDVCFEKPIRGSFALIVSSVFCAAVAGMIIGVFTMGFRTAQSIGIFSGLHGVGGLIGSVLGVTITRALTARKFLSR